MTHRADWTSEDDALLIQLRTFDRTPVSVIAIALGRTEEAVYARCGKLSALVMTRKEWSDDEIARLKALFASGKSCAQIARALGRTVGSTRWKIEDLGLVRPGASGRWSEDDVAKLIRMHAEEATNAAIAEATGRTESGVKDKLRQLGLALPGADPWDAEDDARVRAAAEGRISVEELADDLGRTPAAVRSYAHKIGVRLVIAGSAWTDDDKEKLRAEFAAGSIETAAAALGRSVRATRLQATAMGLITKTGPRHLDEAAKVRIRAAVGLSITEAARTLGHDVRTLKIVAAAEGLSFAVGRKPAAPKVPKAAKVSVPKAFASKGPRLRPAHQGVVAATPRRDRSSARPKDLAVASSPRPVAARKPVSRDVSRMADRFLAWREAAR